MMEPLQERPAAGQRADGRADGRAFFCIRFSPSKVSTETKRAALRRDSRAAASPSPER